jgi:hypothetical protein
MATQLRMQKVRDTCGRGSPVIILYQHTNSCQELGVSKYFQQSKVLQLRDFKMLLAVTNRTTTLLVIFYEKKERLFQLK